MCVGCGRAEMSELFTRSDIVPGTGIRPAGARSEVEVDVEVGKRTSPLLRSSFALDL